MYADARSSGHVEKKARSGWSWRRPRNRRIGNGGWPLQVCLSCTRPACQSTDRGSHRVAASLRRSARLGWRLPLRHGRPRVPVWRCGGASWSTASRHGGKLPASLRKFNDAVRLITQHGDGGVWQPASHHPDLLVPQPRCSLTLRIGQGPAATVPGRRSDPSQDDPTQPRWVATARLRLDPSESR